MIFFVSFFRESSKNCIAFLPGMSYYLFIDKKGFRFLKGVLNMKKISHSFLFLLVMGMLVIASPLMAASDLPLWDSAVNRLLAAGLYGVDVNKTSSSMSMHFKQTKDLYKGLDADKTRMNGQSITFSYEGSSGVLGFSAGYIDTAGMDEDTLGSIFLGLDDPMGFKTYDSTQSWYLALDLSTSFQPHDNFVLGLAGKTLLIKDPSGLEQGRMLSFLLNMPVSYKKYITITPELQWSRPLSGLDNLSPVIVGSREQSALPEDIFYGGVSISFSY